MKEFITSALLASATALSAFAGASSAQAQDNVPCSLILGCQMYVNQTDTPQLWVGQVQMGKQLRDAAARVIQSAGTGYAATCPLPLVTPNAEAAYLLQSLSTSDEVCDHRYRQNQQLWSI